MKIIAIEGLDGAGKETQVKLLRESLHNLGYTTATDGFPRYDKPIGKMIKDSLYQKREFTQQEHAKLYEIDRHQAQGDFDILERNSVDFLVLDRYVISNYTYQQATGALSEVDILWLQHGLRPADLHIILDITVEESMRRTINRGITDKYEGNTAILNSVYNINQKLIDMGTYYGMGDIVGVDGSQLPNDVNTDILNKVKERIIPLM